MGTNAAPTGTILDRIVAACRAAVRDRKSVLPLAALRVSARKADPPRDFAAALCRQGGQARHSGQACDALNVIAELKKASPSRGVLRESYDPAALARECEQGGAAAISVLTEEQFFQGSLAHLRAARQSVRLPLLCKDFIFDPWQVWEARAAGADSFLLIVAILDDAALRELLALGRELGMEPLVEVHTREELARALDAGARILGVNNRDLRSFEVRLETSLELVELVPDGCIAVSESGLRSHEDLVRLCRAGFDAFLVGEHLMQSPDPGAALRVLLGI
jgi:indole-3-glycerol phosphate synthase